MRRQLLLGRASINLVFNYLGAKGFHHSSLKMGLSKTVLNVGMFRNGYIHKRNRSNGNDLPRDSFNPGLDNPGSIEIHP